MRRGKTMSSTTIACHRSALENRWQNHVESGQPGNTTDLITQERWPARCRNLLTGQNLPKSGRRTFDAGWSSLASALC